MATDSLNLPYCCIWYIRSPPLQYSMTKNKRSIVWKQECMETRNGGRPEQFRAGCCLPRRKPRLLEIHLKPGQRKIAFTVKSFWQPISLAPPIRKISCEFPLAEFLIKMCPLGKLFWKTLKRLFTPLNGFWDLRMELGERNIFTEFSSQPTWAATSFWPYE